MQKTSLAVNWEKLNLLVVLFKIKTEEIEKCYQELNNIYKELDGSSDAWAGKEQSKFYEAYQLLSSEFGNNVDTFERYYKFLENVKDSYKESDITNISNIEKSEDDLMV